MGTLSDLATFRFKSQATQRANKVITDEFCQKTDVQTRDAHLNKPSGSPAKILSKSERHKREWSTYVGWG